jgi:hypothetical protein
MAGCASQKIPADVVSVAREVRDGGVFVLEMADDGTVYAAEAEIPLDSVPLVCRDAAKRLEPNGEFVGAERELAGGRWYYEVIVRTAGRRIELLMNPDGSLAGREDALTTDEIPAGIADAGIRAAGGGELIVVERVTGPEAQTGESFHVKVRGAAGEVRRVSVREDGSVVRVMRKMLAEVRVPR